MNQTLSKNNGRQTLLLALFSLFFIQLFSLWNENVFRMSLTKLSMGNEMFGLLLIFTPLLLIACPIRFERTALLIATAGVLLTRAICPFLNAPELIVNTGIGVSASFVMLCYALSGSYRQLGNGLGTGIGLGLLLSVALRTWGSSYDISTGGPGVVIGWGLLVLAAVLSWRTPLVAEEKLAQESGTFLGSVLASVGLFGNMGIVYWALSCPAVISAWSGSNHLMNTICLAGAWTLAIGLGGAPISRISRGILAIWNLAFSGTLLTGIALHLVDYPTSEGSPALVVLPASALFQVPFYLMLILSPVILANVTYLLRQPRLYRPRALVLPVLMGAILLVALSILYIFINTWGYVGEIGPVLRGKFYLPFLVAGLAMILPLLRSPSKDSANIFQERPTALSNTVVIVLALLILIGVIVRTSTGPANLPGKKRLTILTYNLRMGSHQNGDRNYRNQLELLRQIDADIIGLQESDTARPSAGNVDVARYFADALGYHVYFGPSTISGTFGTAILSRFPLKERRTIFTYSMDDETGTAVAEIEVAGTKITLVNSHPAGSPSAKHAHIDAVVKVAQSHKNVIAMGDYNFRQDSVYYAKIARVLNNSWLALYPDAKGPRHPTIGTPTDKQSSTDGMLDMTRRIDHIFLSPNFKVQESYYVPVPESETDHPAHWTVVTWK